MRLTFEQICPDWTKKFEKKTATEVCKAQMNSYTCCAVGEALGLKARVNDDYSTAASLELPITVKYWRSEGVGVCETCSEISHVFNNAYRKKEKSVIEKAKKELVKHMQKDHKDVLIERGLIKA